MGDPDGCWCECEAFDEFVTGIFKKDVSSMAAMQKMCNAVHSRARIPWPWEPWTKQLDLDFIVPPLIQYTLLREARWNDFYVFQIFVVDQALLVMILMYFYVTTVRSSSKFTVVWVVTSMVKCLLFMATSGRMEGMPGRLLYIFLGSVMILSYSHCALGDPGASEKEELSRQTGWCVLCHTHIELRDHHCVWVGQCVGHRTRRSFLVYLLSMTLICADAAAALFSEKLPVRRPEDFYMMIYMGGLGCMCALLLVFQCFLISNGNITSDKVRKLGLIGALSSAEVGEGADANMMEAAGRVGESRARLTIGRVIKSWRRFLTATELSRPHNL
ncbi:unnamed protein product [Chrysoparadoxa australica]